jgi:hypothetical protein
MDWRQPPVCSREVFGNEKTAARLAARPAAA